MELKKGKATCVVHCAGYFLLKSKNLMFPPFFSRTKKKVTTKYLINK